MLQGLKDKVISAGIIGAVKVQNLLLGNKVPWKNVGVRMLKPYHTGSTWVFDDPATGLVAEPFVLGIPEMIDIATAHIPNARSGFKMFFSITPHPNHDYSITWLRSDSGGNWYRLDGTDMEGWLCPELYRYFQCAPKKVYLWAEPA